ncbi:MAG: hypothetical protein ACPH6D_06790, partial [Candidatus Puniceispirillales bacterium]
LMSKTITFNWDFWERKRAFRKPSDAEIQTIKKKCNTYSNAGYESFITGNANQNPGIVIITGKNPRGYPKMLLIAQYGDLKLTRK